MHRWILALALAASLAGCGPKPDEDTAVRSVFEQVRAGQVDAVAENLAPGLDRDQAHVELQRIHDTFIPMGDLRAKSPAGA
ncbi:MAG: hypothetical protein R3C16_06050 [Hyphomonadaceae bacterium]